MFAIVGEKAAVQYVDSRNFTEPMFVFVIMVIAGTRPILQTARAGARLIARLIPLPGSMGFYFIVLSLVPLLGSFITEPAAMTLAALILADSFFGSGMSSRLKYATLGVLFVNISIGGTLTPFAAPPVLMVAGKWNWDLAFMLSTFGWKAALAVLVNATLATAVLGRHPGPLAAPSKDDAEEPRVPPALVVVHVALLGAVIVLAHHPVAFIGVFLMFLGVAQAYERHQNPLIVKEALLVGFFLAGLVVLGGMQSWWLEPIVSALEPHALFFGALALTAVTDNAALTYLGSLVVGMPDPSKYMLVAGAVAGGGLTVIANAPNPAGIALLKRGFADESVGAGDLLVAALAPTAIAAAAFLLL
jgi:hypothetical protein